MNIKINFCLQITNQNKRFLVLQSEFVRQHTKGSSRHGYLMFEDQLGNIEERYTKLFYIKL